MNQINLFTGIVCTIIITIVSSEVIAKKSSVDYCIKALGIQGSNIERETVESVMGLSLERHYRRLCQNKISFHKSYADQLYESTIKKYKRGVVYAGVVSPAFLVIGGSLGSYFLWKSKNSSKQCRNEDGFYCDSEASNYAYSSIAMFIGTPVYSIAFLLIGAATIKIAKRRKNQLRPLVGRERSYYKTSSLPPKWSLTPTGLNINF